MANNQSNGMHNFRRVFLLFFSSSHAHFRILAVIFNLLLLFARTSRTTATINGVHLSICLHIGYRQTMRTSECHCRLAWNLKSHSYARTHFRMPEIKWHIKQMYIISFDEACNRKFDAPNRIQCSQCILDFCQMIWKIYSNTLIIIRSSEYRSISQLCKFQTQ